MKKLLCSLVIFTILLTFSNVSAMTYRGVISGFQTDNNGQLFLTVESQRQPVVFAEDITVMAETGVPIMSPLMPPPPPPPVPVIAAPPDTSSSTTEQNQETIVEWGIVEESINPDTGERTVIYGEVVTSIPTTPEQQSGADVPVGHGVPTVLTNIIGSRVEIEFNSAGEIIFIQILERPPPMLPRPPNTNPNTTPAQNNNISQSDNANEITVTLNGETINFDVMPVVIDDRTLVPMRAIFEALGFEVEWDGDTQMIFAQQGEQLINLQIGNYEMRLGESPYISFFETVTLDVPPQIIDDRTLVPVRAIAEATGANVDWDDNTRTVVITTN